MPYGNMWAMWQEWVGRDDPAGRSGREECTAATSLSQVASLRGARRRVLVVARDWGTRTYTWTYRRTASCSLLSLSLWTCSLGESRAILDTCGGVDSPTDTPKGQAAAGCSTVCLLVEEPQAVGATWCFWMGVLVEQPAVGCSLASVGTYRRDISLRAAPHTALSSVTIHILAAS